MRVFFALSLDSLVYLVYSFTSILFVFFLPHINCFTFAMVIEENSEHPRLLVIRGTSFFRIILDVGYNA